MKRFLLLVIPFCFSFIGISQNVIWQNDFSNPADWTFQDNGSNPAANWIITTDVNAIPFFSLNPAQHSTASNGYALIDNRNIAPEGFRVPNIQDIITLAENLGFPNENDYSIYYNGKVAYTLKSEKTWKKSFFGEPGNNETGLSFLAGGNLGMRYGELEFNDKGTTAGHWLFDEYIPKEGVQFFPAPPDNWPKTRFHSFSIGTGGNHCLSVENDLIMGGLFIRCIKE